MRREMLRSGCQSSAFGLGIKLRWEFAFGLSGWVVVVVHMDVGVVQSADGNQQDHAVPYP
jgi:hypothetical protein